MAREILMKEQESRQRSLGKTITWRLVATGATILLVYLFTGKIDLALEVGALEIILKLLLFYVHERVWNRVKWGKKRDDHSI